jgi:O-antigen ligase
MIGVAHGTRAATIFHDERYARFVDAIVVALAVSLPWSTSATGILVALWLIVMLPTLDVTALRWTLATPAGGIPVLLWVLALVGMLWAFDVSWAERWAGLKGFHKFLLIPLLIVQFQRSERAAWVLTGFLLSCGLLLVMSGLLILRPNLPGPWARKDSQIGVPVKDYIAQSGEFTFCIFVLAAVALNAWHVQRRWYALAAVLLALVLLANVLYAAHSRTALVVIPVLLLLFACKHLNWKGMASLLLAGAVAAALTWSLVRPVRDNVTNLLNEVRQFQPAGESTRAGERLEFWRKSLGFIADAPIVGHGTGSIHDQFRRSVAQETGMAALASENPHNQTFAVAIQLGLAGAVVLFAMWMAHLSVFRGSGFAAWVGLVVVTQNVVSSLFNSHLFDFTQGWAYVVGVGVTAGVVFRDKASGTSQGGAQSIRGD